MRPEETEDRGHPLTVDVADGLPKKQDDRERLAKLLTNLLSKAAKYTLAGRGMVRCSMADNGLVISEEDQQQLFVKYFRSTDRGVREMPGTGLGLVIVKSLVEVYGSEITVDSTLGKETTLSLTLPLVSDEAQAP